MRYFSALFVLLFSLVSWGQVDLGYNFKKGDQFKIRMDADQGIKQDMMGQTIEINQKLYQGMDFKVLDASNGQYTLSCSVYYLKYGMDMPMMGTSMMYDSEDPGNSDSEMAFMSGMLDKPFEVVIDRAGQVIEINGMDEMIDGMFDEMDLDEQTKAQAEQQMDGIMGEKAFRGSMDQVLRFLPGKKVNVGDTWGSETTLSNFDIQLQNEFTLKDVTDGKAMIAMVSTIDGAAEQEMNGVAVSITMNGTQNADLRVDTKTGILIDGTLKQEIKGISSTMGMEIPMSISSDTKLYRE